MIGLMLAVCIFVSQPKTDIITVWEEYNLSTKTTIGYELEKTEQGRLLTVIEDKETFQTLEVDGEIWQTHSNSITDNGLVICTKIDQFPQVFIPKDASTFSVIDNLSLGSLGVTWHTNMRIGGLTFGYYDGFFRKWPEHCMYLKAIGILPPDGHTRGGPGPGFCAEGQDCGHVTTNSCYSLYSSTYGQEMECGQCTDRKCNQFEWHYVSTFGFVWIGPVGTNFCCNKITTNCAEMRNCQSHNGLYSCDMAHPCPEGFSGPSIYLLPTDDWYETAVSCD